MPRLIFSRLPRALLPPFYTASATQQAAHKLTAPAKRAFWKMLQRNIIRQFGLEGSLFPSLSVDADLLYSGQVIDAQWNKVLRDGIIMHRERER